MNSTRVFIATAIASLVLATSPAIAGNGNGQGKDKGKGGPPSHVEHGPPGNAPHDNGQHDNGRHLGWYKQQWKRGDRLPLAYVEPRYYLDDYRDYRLHAPPRGYRWVRPMDDRYLLVEIATGVISEVLGY